MWLLLYLLCTLNPQRSVTTGGPWGGGEAAPLMTLLIASLIGFSDAWGSPEEMVQIYQCTKAMELQGQPEMSEGLFSFLIMKAVDAFSICINLCAIYCFC